VLVAAHHVVLEIALQLLQIVFKLDIVAALV